MYQGDFDPLCDDFDPLSAPVFGPAGCGRNTELYFSKKKKSTGRENSIRFDSEGYGDHLRRISGVIQEESSAEVPSFAFDMEEEDLQAQVKGYVSSSSSSEEEEPKKKVKNVLTATVRKPKLSIKEKDEPALLSDSTSSSSGSDSEEEVGDASSPSKKESETLPEKKEWKDFEEEEEGFLFFLVFRIIMIIRTVIFSSIEPELDEQGEIKEYVVEIEENKFSRARGLNGKFPFDEAFFREFLYDEKTTVFFSRQNILKINWLTCFHAVMAFFSTHESPSTDCFFIPVDYKKNITFSRELSNGKKYDVLFNGVNIGEINTRVDVHDQRENLVLKVLFNGKSFDVVLSSSVTDEDFCSLEFSSTELSHLFNETIASKKSIEDGSDLEGGVIYDLIGSSVLVEIKTKRTMVNVEGQNIEVDAQLMTLPRVLFME
jgi:hypothetical protein